MGSFQIDANKARKITNKADIDRKTTKQGIKDINYWIAYNAVQGRSEYMHYAYLNKNVTERLHKYYSDLGFVVTINDHYLKPYYILIISW